MPNRELQKTEEENTQKGVRSSLKSVLTETFLLNVIYSAHNKDTILPVFFFL